MSRNQRSASRPLSMPLASCLVAVIGAGAAGLVTARELRREGHSVVVFERGDQVGGTWVYTPRVESDPLGLDPTRTIVHSSLYSSLRSNLPREAMGFRDYPFVPRDEPGRDPRRFPGHREVHMYLVDFAREFGIGELVRLETEVVRVGLVEGSKWRVTSRKEGEGETDVDEIFDAIVVCNGHFSEPLIDEIPGISKWPGKQIHSHNYRVPEPFRGQTVVLIGGSASAMDISRDIAGVAKEVHVAARRLVLGGDRKQSGYDNLWLHRMTESVEEDGTVHFEDGCSITADAIIHCTGYKYDFPFLDTNGLVTVDDNRVGPLYKHVFPPALAPWLSFVGIPRKVFTFPLSESQSKWIAGVLSGRLKLPSQQEMMEEIKAFYSSLEVSGTPKRHTHDLHDLQFEHYEWLAAQCGVTANEEWRKEMLYSTIKNVLARPDNFRDEWEDDDLFVQAYKDFSNYTTNHFGD